MTITSGKTSPYTTFVDSISQEAAALLQCSIVRAPAGNKYRWEFDAKPDLSVDALQQTLRQHNFYTPIVASWLAKNECESDDLK